MAQFNEIESGMFFTITEKNGIYIGEKLDASSLPKEFQAGYGSESSFSIPHQANRDEYSAIALHNNSFNIRVIAAVEAIDYNYSLCHTDAEVDVFSPSGLTGVISRIEREIDSIINIR